MPTAAVPKSQASTGNRSLKKRQAVSPAEGERKAALDYLGKMDPALRLVRHRLGNPPSWQRPAGFETLARITLEQQVSLRSAESTFLKLQHLLAGPLTADGMVSLSSLQTRACGVSRQKHRYLHQLAEDVVQGRFQLDRLPEMDNRGLLNPMAASSVT